MPTGMRTLIALLFTLLALPAAEVPWRLVDDGRSAVALERMLATSPAPQAWPEDEAGWLFAVAILADRARRYDVAEAAMLAASARWPHLSWAWTSLACYQGKQGRYADALATSCRG